MNTEPCSCGNTNLHRLAVRRTFDDVQAELWSDGSVNLGSGRFGYSNKRTVGLDAGWLLMDEVCLYTRAEWSHLCASAKRAVKTDSPITKLRSLMHIN